MTRTPKQRVLARYPSARAEWIPGWGLWEIQGCHARDTTGFTAREAWLRVAESLLP